MKRAQTRSLYVRRAHHHSLGATGARITCLVDELRRRTAKYTVGSACIDNKQRLASILERA